MRTRPAAVAGAFYPASPVQLQAQVDKLLAKVDSPAPPPRAMIVPHAGYVYSGSTAAMGYASLRGAAGTIKHVVIVGPSHFVGISAIAVPSADLLATPLGDVRVWTDGVVAAMGCPEVEFSEHVHEREHSLEVQLPFLQRVLPDADVLALAAGWVAPDVVEAVLDTVVTGPETFIIISSDLSHYLPYDEARAIDAGTIRQIEALDPHVHHDQACGATGLNAMLLLAARRGLKPRVLCSCNSGDTAGDRSRVVGYTAVAFYDGDRG